MSVWYRVIDPLSPLFGCDVKIGETVYTDEVQYWKIVGMRRVDVFVGDRPFQLIARPGQTLGLLIDPDGLAVSQIQDETVELKTDRPWGKCVNESEMTRADGVTLIVVDYEKAIQMSLLDKDRHVLTKKMLVHGTDFRKSFNGVIELFSKDAEVSDMLSLVSMMGD